MKNLDEYKYKKAKERVEDIKGFYIHALVYLIAISFLAYFNSISTSFPWVVFPALGWGIGLLAHGMQAYGYFPFLGKNWEERKIKEFMESDQI